eukprot:GFUD01131368.1.p1 GENE.GFUD01131368.1~~GFUD01131368.1.p1  ORF type:complete len:170 (+),score=49.68 GFUD01131368.1:73-582(+)
MMAPVISVVLFFIFSDSLAHPVSPLSAPNTIHPTTPATPLSSKQPEHTGSIFDGMEPEEEDYADYYYDEADSSQVTTDLPLPAGPTRRPGQAVPLPLNTETPDNSVFRQMANLPLLTTKKTTIEGTTRQPRTHFGRVLSANAQIGSLLVHSSMDIVDQTKLFSKMDPFQ